MVNAVKCHSSDEKVQQNPLISGAFFLAKIQAWSSGYTLFGMISMVSRDCIAKQW